MWRERPVPPTATAGSPGSGSPVPPKQHFGCTKTFGAVFFGGIKSPCGNGDTHSLGFPHKNTVFSCVKTLGRVFWGMKKRRRQLAPATPRFYLFDSSFSVKIKKKTDFLPLPKGSKSQVSERKMR